MWADEQMGVGNEPPDPAKPVHSAGGLVEQRHGLLRQLDPARRRLRKERMEALERLAYDPSLHRAESVGSHAAPVKASLIYLHPNERDRRLSLIVRCSVQAGLRTDPTANAGGRGPRQQPPKPTMGCVARSPKATTTGRNDQARWALALIDAFTAGDETVPG